MGDTETLIRDGTALQAAWRRYADALEEMRVAMERASQFTENPEQRGMAYRQLMEVQAMAYNFVMAPRTAHPRLFRNTAWQTEFYTIGGNGPDFDYRTAFLDGKHSYRLTGKVNDSRTLVAQVNSATPGQSGSRCLANYDLRTLADDDGRIDIVLSAEEHPGNWIALLPDADYQWMMIRPTVEEYDDVPAALEIERISPLAPGPESDEYSEEAVARRIDLATSFVRYVLTDWSIGYTQLVLRNAGDYNRFITFNVVEAGELGSPAAQYLQAVFEVEEDEALLIEFHEEPDGSYWSLQLYDLWQHSLPFRTQQCTLNGRQMVRDADGKVRVVLSARDPGIANWLDNGGYRRGEMIWRNYLATRNVPHDIHRVKLADLDGLLPAETARITPEERAGTIERRRRAYLRRHGE